MTFAILILRHDRSRRCRVPNPCRRLPPSRCPHDCGAGPPTRHLLRIVADLDGRIPRLSDCRSGRPSGCRSGRRPRRCVCWPASSPGPSSVPGSGWSAAADSAPCRGSWLRRSAWVVGCCSAPRSSGSDTSLADVAVMAAAHRPGPRRGPDSGAAGSDPTTLVVGAGHAVPVGARLGRHHPGRDSRRGAVHHLRSQRCRHLLRPVRSAVVRAAARGTTARWPALLAPTPRS